MTRVFFLALLFSLGCGFKWRETPVEQGIREQILHINNATEPQDLDPHIVTGIQEHHLMMALLEGLVSEDPKDLHPVPGVAERWDISPDGTVYTFHLRSNARWSNGDPVTAADFAKSYHRILAPTLASEYAYMLYVMKNAEAFNTGKLTNFSEVGVQAIDARTLRIFLNAPTPYFLSLLNHYSWWPVPISTIEKCGPLYERGNRWTRPKNFVGNGSFTLKDWKVNNVIVVDKSQTYWDAARVKLRRICFYSIESTDTEERAFRSGQLHITYLLPQTKIDSYRRQHPELLRIDPHLATYFYVINVNKPPLTDKRIRRALGLAIDRESIVKNVARGGQLPATFFTPPDTAGYTPTARMPTDIEGARRLLKEAGYPDGRGLPPIEILFNTLELHRSIAEAIQEMWKKNLNIDARLLNQEWKVYLDSMRQGNYNVSRFGWTGDYPDPNSFLDMWVTDGGNNKAGWSSHAYDDFIHRAGMTGDLEERKRLFAQAEAILLDEAPVLPIYFYTRTFLIHPSVRGWYPTLLDNHPYKYVYLEAPTK